MTHTPTFVGLIGLTVAVLLIGYVSTQIFPDMASRVRSNTNLGSSGIITEENVSLNATEIYWGMLSPNETVQKSILINNTTNKPLTLGFSANNWNPLNASDYMTFRTDYQNQTLQPHGSLAVTLILHISPNIYGIHTFSFDITIIGTEI